jgi:hypothetical protein
MVLRDVGTRRRVETGYERNGRSEKREEEGRDKREEWGGR